MQAKRTKVSFLLFSIFILIGVSTPTPAFADARIPPTFRFERTLKSGMQNTDIRYLQILLNRDSETRVNAPGLLGGAGNETDFFGPATKNAVIKFQNKYASDVLAPAGLLRGTGLVGLFTRARLDALLALLAVKSSVTQNVRVVPPKEEKISVTLTVPANSMSASTEATSTGISFEEVNTATRTALVNILCTSRRGGLFNPISGSGVIVDPRGVILTTAHIGQYFLLEDFPTPGSIECLIRDGAPARNHYKATLLFISSDWIRDNASKITAEEATGTGENDFALLLITGMTDPTSSLPTTFHFIPMDFSNSALAHPREVLAVAYPAGFLNGISIQTGLYPSSSVVTIGAIYSFGGNTPDLFSIGGSVVAQHGSSGGAIVSLENKLIGLIVTASNATMTGDRNLNALTLSHLNDSFRKQNGDDIASLFVGNLPATASNFRETVAPTLRKIIIDAVAPR